MKYKRNSKKKIAKKTAPQMEKQIKTIEKEIKKLNPPNYRYVTIAPNVYSTGLVNSSPQSILINGIATGTDELTRIGDIGRCVNVKFNVEFTANTALLLPAWVRVMLVREITALGSSLQASQFMQTSGPGPLTLRNYVTRNDHRYVIYYDECKLLCPLQSQTANVYNGINMATPSAVLFRFDKNIGFNIDYSRDATNGVSAIDTNSLHIFVCTDNATANAINVLYASVVKLTF